VKIIAPARGFQLSRARDNEMNWSYNYSRSKRDSIGSSGGRMNRAPRRFLLFIFTVAPAAGLSLFTVFGAGNTNEAAAADAGTSYNRQCVPPRGRDGRGKMPAFRKKISENDIHALVAYVRRMRR
jgi:hypothetical protein